MIGSKPLPTIGKGQLRCFHCRQAFQMKEGKWHDHKNQQIFLCKACARVQLAAIEETPNHG